MLTNRAATRLYGAANTALAVRPEYTKAATETGYGDIQLVREGDYAVVKIKAQGRWVEVIKEHLQGHFCHSVTSIGIADAVKKEGIKC